jgi:hypothetical protein
MGSFLGGSAFAMARGIADGYHLVTERSFKTMNSGDISQLSQEMDNVLREARGDQPSVDDMEAVKARNRRIQRLNTALMILRSYQLKTRK